MSECCGRMPLAFAGSRKSSSILTASAHLPALRAHQVSGDQLFIHAPTVPSHKTLSNRAQGLPRMAKWVPKGPKRLPVWVRGTSPQALGPGGAGSPLWRGVLRGEAPSAKNDRDGGRYRPPVKNYRIRISLSLN